MTPTFWKIRIGTFIWGFLVLYYFTGQLDFTSKVFFVQMLGNTAVIWYYTRKEENRHPGGHGE